MLKRPRSPFTTARFRLHSLAEELTYEVTNLDTRATETVPGNALAEGELTGQPDSALLRYCQR
ncbi:MAG: hypothetical protein COZ06_27730 [Armatimonadetes bacterium CG_4_10_14_3_um_filter_66_18]|nr:hypothetical protein [Armatimonadota bacterium]OIP10663.1 MAG: hypothetical protein AUJ96_03625 [Armatimonadetes bacterium CG2_30_66_41]PIU91944.1 MAG: hypothetical protein COS65_20160 [Armatimonadetes bacterium CG06_land_8_20_14_3_00_66_21]PIX39342.1 MAG: hypothetical protein COZ57_28500 [Armatimonadetes bacterium CG_4_8_14_3_um_filter_66_20]PIY40735.1 MAG: hypothetical protein COZ06_27730 [Armatimonadetes bacterium CG_4_10_14_3_um_filter_66_18]PIZ44100.1 MAG: hypothetical protein COY42_14